MVVRVSRSSRRVRPSQMVSADSSSVSEVAADSAAAASASAASTRRRCASATGLSTRSILLELMFEYSPFIAGGGPLGAVSAWGWVTSSSAVTALREMPDEQRARVAGTAPSLAGSASDYGIDDPRKVPRA